MTDINNIAFNSKSLNDNDLPAVSVIIPVHNRPEMLLRSVKSVFKQTVENIEIIIVDDASVPSIDKAMFTSLELSSDQLKKITLITLPENQGVSSARNAGIEKSAAPFIAFLDSDDEWLPKKLETQLKFLSAAPRFRMVHSEEIWIRNGRRVNPKKHHCKSPSDLFAASLERCIISPSTVLMHRDVMRDIGMFDTSLPVCEDYDLWLRILANEKVGFIETPLIKKYGGHDDQLSFRYPAMDRWRVKAMQKLLSNRPLSSKQQEQVLQTIRKKSEILLQGAKKRAQSGNRPA